MTDDTMKEKINEEVLCVLRKGNANQIIIDYVEIVNPFKTIIDKLAVLCEKPETTIQQIVSYLINTKDFEQLTAKYRYCFSLKDAYQGFTANNQDFIKEINKRLQLILFNEKVDPTPNKLEEKIERLKREIKRRYFWWSKAFSINNTYRLCQEDNSIIIFSHRIDGWSNPVYQLTANFSVEIKTNFGYGGVSYFYTKMKYKNIEITPFSEWVDYEFARFSEIIRYTQSHILKNEYWFEAMEFSRDACNLSLTDEVKFVEKYVIDECEKMVSGLEELFNKEHFTFKNRNRKEYSVDKKGHVLVEFRGEKISGALDFISKILEFDKIVAIKTFIQRIEDCNAKIQPILVEEAKILKLKIEKLAKEKNELQPKYDKVLKTDNEYNAKLIKLQAEMIVKRQLNSNCIDTQKLDNAFISKFPDYAEFKEEQKRVTDSYRILTEQIQNNTKVRDNIELYNEKITKHLSSSTYSEELVSDQHTGGSASKE